MIVTTESIVLRARKQGDTSRIVTLYTRDFGLLTVIAKGAREMRSPFASSLQLFNHISAVFYKKENRDLYLLSKAEPLSRMDGIQQSLEQLTAASKVAQLVQRAMHDEQADARLFDLLLSTLKQIAQGPPEKAAILSIYFYYAFAALEGFALQLPAAPVGDRFVFDLSTGEIEGSAYASSQSGDRRFMPISAPAVKVLTAFMNHGAAGLPAGPQSAVTDELDSTLGKYLRAHIEVLRAGKSS